MTHKTAIGWATDSANPYRYEAGGWHCVKVSEGCRHCYAEMINKRFGGSGNRLPYRVDSRQHLGAMSLSEKILADWLNPKRPTRRIFVNSMTDTFLETVPDELVMKLFDTMAAAKHQLFYVLTKRAKRMAELVLDWLESTNGRYAWVPHNIMIGVSVENQKVLQERMHWLGMVPALRFASAEPLLGPVDFGDTISALHWLIIGGESGAGARHLHPLHATNLLQQAEEANVWTFFKQWGSWWPLSEFAQHHGGPDTPLAYRSWGVLCEDGTFQSSRNFRERGKWRLPALEQDGRVVMVKPPSKEVPESATLNGVVYEQYSPLHQPQG
jgi:protein gp37